MGMKSPGYELLMTDVSRTLAVEAESFKWSEVRRGLLELQVWFSATAYFAILSGMYSFGLFVCESPCVYQASG